MEIDAGGRAVLEERESRQHVAYPDPESPLAKACNEQGISFLNGGYKSLPGWGGYSGAPWTIGIGHTGPEVHEGLVWDDAKISAVFAEDIKKYSAAVNESVHVPLTQNQFNALVSFSHNLGVNALPHGGNLGAPSRLLRALNAGDYAGASRAFRAWIIPASITSRRAGEWVQFNTPDGQPVPARDHFDDRFP